MFAGEVENLLLQFFHFKKMPVDVYEVTVKQLRDYNVQELSVEVVDVIDLARSASISLFDAAYLDLSLRRRAPLASRDRAPAEAAHDRGVRVHDLRGGVE